MRPEHGILPTDNSTTSAEHKYQELYDNMPVATLTVQADGRVVRANKALREFLGVLALEDIGDHLLNGLLSGLSSLQKIAGSDQPEYRDSHIVTDAHGEQRHVAVFARSVQSRDVAAMDVYVTDVTEQEQQARRATEAENYRREIYDSSPVMMLSLDVALKVVDTNRIFAENIGRSANQVVGQSIVSFLGEDTDRGAFARSAARIQRGEVVRDIPITIDCADGTVMECAYSASPHVDANGMVVGMIAMLANVGDRNRAQRERDALEAQLQLTQKLESIGELAAGIAHEINTPAQYVSDNLSFLRESFDDVDAVLSKALELLTATAACEPPLSETHAMTEAVDEADVEYLREEIPAALLQGQDGIAKIREIVLALKDFSHPGTGSIEPSDVNRLIESTVTVARNEYKYIADLSLDLDSSLPMVDCHPSALGQVVLNIVVNAAHAISAQEGRSEYGKIDVSTRCLDDEQIEIRIADNGPGVPESLQSKIFDPFFTTKEVGKGTGQGLAISRRVVTEQHAGQLLLDNQPGAGACFRIVLPVRHARDNDPLGAVA